MKKGARGSKAAASWLAEDHVLDLIGDHYLPMQRPKDAQKRMRCDIPSVPYYYVILMPIPYVMLSGMPSSG